MGNNIAIKVENLSKHYLLNKFALTKSDTLYGNLFNQIKNLKNLTRKKETTDFWALKDVSFEVQQGDKVGIIGRNGAGKSTLLKILSRITPPTAGTIEYYGRMASLLEVGTGFHGDLSGRENIYLNGSILGMSKHEIKSKFDEIVAFSEIEQFIDTPVKRYSSGMYVRLAFAVAAHLEPEILIVDEVLAVGDAAFQKKCLGKMNEVAKNGRTILFVSHNMVAVQNLCNKGIVLSKGKVTLPVCEASQAINYYLNEVKSTINTDLKNRTDRQGEGKIKITAIEFIDEDDKIQNTLISGQLLKIKLFYACYNNPSPENIAASIAIYGDDGILYSVLGNEYSSSTFDKIKQEGCFLCTILKLPFVSGSYLINIAVTQNGITQDWVQEAAIIDVESGDYYGTGKIIPSSHKSVLIENNWEYIPL